MVDWLAVGKTSSPSMPATPSLSALETAVFNPSPSQMRSGQTPYAYAHNYDTGYDSWGGGWSDSNYAYDYAAQQRAAAELAARQRAEAEAKARAEAERIRVITENAIKSVSEMLKTQMANLQKVDVPVFHQRTLPDIATTIARIQSFSPMTVSAARDVLDLINNDVKQIYVNLDSVVSKNDPALNLALDSIRWLDRAKIYTDINVVVENAKRAIQDSPFPAAATVAINDIFATAKADIGSLDTTRDIETVKSISERALFDVYDTGARAIDSAKTPAELASVRADIDSAFVTVAGMANAATKTIKDLFGTAANDRVASIEDSTNYWIEQALGADWKKTLATQTIDQAVREMVQATEKDVFDINRIEANRLISEAIPDLVGTLREYANAVAPNMIDLVKSSPADVKEFLKTSDVFHFVLNEALMSGKSEQTVREIAEVFGHKIHDAADFEKMRPEEMTGKFFDVPGIGLQYITPDSQVVMLSPDSYVKRLLGDGLIPLSESMAINTLRVQNIMYNDLTGNVALDGLKMLYPSYMYEGREFVPIDYGRRLSVTSDTEMRQRMESFRQFTQQDLFPGVKYDPDDKNCDWFTREFISKASQYYPEDDLRYGYVDFTDGRSHAVPLYKVGERVFENGTIPIYIAYEPQTGAWFDPSEFDAAIHYAVVSKGLSVDGNRVTFDRPELAYLGQGFVYDASEFTQGIIVASAPEAGVVQFDTLPVTQRAAAEYAFGLGEIDTSLLSPSQRVLFNEILRGNENVAYTAPVTLGWQGFGLYDEAKYKASVESMLARVSPAPMSVALHIGYDPALASLSKDKIELKDLAASPEKLTATYVESLVDAWGNPAMVGYSRDYTKVVLNDASTGQPYVLTYPVGTRLGFNSPTVRVMATTATGTPGAISFEGIGTPFTAPKGEAKKPSVPSDASTSIIVSQPVPKSTTPGAQPTGKKKSSDEIIPFELQGRSEVERALESTLKPVSPGQFATIFGKATGTSTTVSVTGVESADKTIVVTPAKVDRICPSWHPDYAAAQETFSKPRDQWTSRDHKVALAWDGVEGSPGPKTETIVLADWESGVDINKVIELSGRSVIEQDIAKKAAGLPIGKQPSGVETLGGYMAGWAKMVGLPSGWMAERIMETDGAKELSAEVRKIAEPITHQLEARYELASLTVDGRVTDRGKEVANVVANILMVTGGHIDITKMTPDQRKTVDMLTEGTGVKLDVVFPNMIVLDDGRRFGETPIKEFTLGVVDDTTLKTLMSQSAVAKNLASTVGGAYTDAGKRLDTAEANALKIEAVKENNVATYTRVRASEGLDGITTPDGKYTFVPGIVGGGQQYYIPRGMDPVVFEGMLNDGLVTRGTSWDGTLRLTDEGNAIKNQLVNMIAINTETTEHGGTVEIPVLSSVDRALASYGLQDHDIQLLAGRRDGVDQFGQPVTQQSIIDRVSAIDTTLADAVEHRMELYQAARNPGDLVLAKQMTTWLDNGWIGVYGTITAKGIEARDQLLSEFIDGRPKVDYGDLPTAKSIAQLQSERSFMLATADASQLEQLKKSDAAHKLTPSEQLVVGEPELSFGDRAARITYAAGDFIRDLAVGPAFDDPRLNAAFFGLGILPTGWFSKGAKAASEIVKIADAPGGVAKLADMWLGMKGPTTQVDQMDMMAAAKRELTPEKYKAFREAIAATPGGEKYLDDFSLIASSLRVANADDVAKIASMSPERLLLEANSAPNMAFFGSMKDGDWVRYVNNLRAGGVPDESIRNIENVRNGYMRVTSDMFRPAEHMDPANIVAAGRSPAMWQKLADVPATAWDSTVGTLVKNGADAKDLDSMRTLGDLRAQRATAAGKTDFLSIFDATPLDKISKSDAALLAPNELDAILARSYPEHLAGRKIDDIQNLMNRRVEGQADLIRNSMDYNKLTQAEKDVLTKFETSRVFNLTPAEQKVLTDLTEKIGVSRMASLAESVGARISFDTVAKMATYPVTHPLHAAAAAFTAVYMGKQAYEIAVAGPSFALFLSQEASQFAFAFGPMSAADDPLLKAEALANGMVTLREIQDATPIGYLLAMRDAPFSQYWAPSLNNGLIFQYRSTPNQAETLRNSLIEAGAWVMTDDQTSYLWSYDKDGNEIIKVLQGRPATRDEFLDRLNEEPSLLSNMDPKVYKNYIDQLYVDRGWTDERLAKEWIDGNIVGYALYNASPSAVTNRVDAYNKDEVNKLGMPLPEYIGLGSDLSDIWKNPRVQAEFKTPDGKQYDVSKLADAVLGGQISMYALNTYTKDAAVALLKEGTYNPDPKYMEARNKLLADDDGFALAMQTYTPGALMSMAQRGSIPANQLYKLKSIDPDVEKIAALPSSVPMYAPSYDSNGQYIPYAQAAMDFKVNHMLTDGSIDPATKGQWFSAFMTTANPHLDDNDIGYLYSIGSISQADLYKWTDNSKDIAGTVASLKQSGQDPVSYYKNLMDREFTVAVPAFGLTPPYGAKNLEFRPTAKTVDLSKFPTLQMALSTPGFLANNLPAFTTEMAALYQTNPDQALQYWLSVAKNTPDLDRSNAYSALPPGLQSAISAYNSDPNNFTTGGRADESKGSWVAGTSLYWTDANNKQRFVDLTGGEYGRGSVYDVETGKWMSIADVAKELGVDPSSIKFDTEAYLNWVAGKSDSKDFIIAADQKTASKISGGGGGGGGGGRGGGGQVTYPSAVTGIFIDCNVLADVSVNGMRMGQSGQLIPLAPGDYTVEISALGYTTKTMMMTVLATRATNMSVTLYRGSLTICDFVTAVGGSFSVDKIHFVYAYCMYRGWTEAANEALKHFTKPTMQPTKFTKNDCTYVYNLAVGKYNEANAMIETQVVCSSTSPA